MCCGLWLIATTETKSILLFSGPSKQTTLCMLYNYDVTKLGAASIHPKPQIRGCGLNFYLDVCGHLCRFFFVALAMLLPQFCCMFKVLIRFNRIFI